jgi:hypothetical protein
VTNYFRKEMGNWAVAPYAFKPHRKRDVDGMSFFRQIFTTAQAVAKRSTHVHGVRVANISGQQLRGLDLTAEPSPNADELPGHIIVPDMRWVDRSSQTMEERRIEKDRSVKLAQFATANRVYVPAGLSEPVTESQNSQN